MNKFGPDNIVDYTAKDAQKQLEQYGKYVNIMTISVNHYNFNYIFLPNWKLFIKFNTIIIKLGELYHYSRFHEIWYSAKTCVKEDAANLNL